MVSIVQTNSSRRQYSIYKAMMTTWTLRLTLAASPDRDVLQEMISDETSKFLGVHDIFNNMDGEPLKYFSVREMRKGLRNRLDELEANPPDFQKTYLGANIAWLSSKLKLDMVEQMILAFAVLHTTKRVFSYVLEKIDVYSSPDRVYEELSPMLGLPSSRVRSVLSDRSLLVQSGLITINPAADNFCNMLSSSIDRVLLNKHDGVDSLLRSFLREATPAKLKQEDFSHLTKDLELLCSYLMKVRGKKVSGVNILLYGDPGVGKSEFARLIAKKLGQTLYEVACDDDDGSAINGQARFSSFMLSQKILAIAAESIILFDEIEDVFPSSTSGLLALFSGDEEKSSASHGKAWVNRVLETNPVPAIWITNSISQIDPAYLRRFDYTLEFPRPPKEARRRIAHKYLSPAKATPHFLDRISTWEEVTPSQLEKAAKVARIAASSPAEAESLAERTLKHSARLLGQTVPSAMSGQSPGYDLAYLNTSIPMAQLITGLKARPSGTFCLYGAPGTGKTAFARHLADSISKPLLVRRASDILSKWLGESEQNIAQMFQEARQEGAVLVLDEADSLLADRRGANQSWEITQVNELLTQMEDFAGIFICTTNLLDRLDPASLRRFAFKIRFDCLNRGQRRHLFEAELSRLAPGSGTVNENVMAKLDRLDKLTPGDFSAVARQWALWATQPSADALISALEEECRVKGGSGRGIGFTV